MTAAAAAVTRLAVDRPRGAVQGHGDYDILLLFVDAAAGGKNSGDDNDRRDGRGEGGVTLITSSSSSCSVWVGPAGLSPFRRLPVAEQVRHRQRRTCVVPSSSFIPSVDRRRGKASSRRHVVSSGGGRARGMYFCGSDPPPP